MVDSVEISKDAGGTLDATHGQLPSKEQRIAALEGQIMNLEDSRSVIEAAYEAALKLAHRIYTRRNANVSRRIRLLRSRIRHLEET